MPCRNRQGIFDFKRVYRGFLRFYEIKYALPRGADDIQASGGLKYAFRRNSVRRAGEIIHDVLVVAHGFMTVLGR